MSQTPDKLNELKTDIKNILADLLLDSSVPSQKAEKALAAITTAYAEAIRSAVPEKRDPTIYQFSNGALERNLYNQGYNVAIDTFTTNLKNQGLLSNGKDK